MEVVVALAIGVLAGSGIWLLLRPRTFQVIIATRGMTGTDHVDGQERD